MAGTSLGDVIDRARRQSFVGRRSELRTFDDARVGRSPRRVLFVHGPGGIGKTTLLLEMRARASAAGRAPPGVLDRVVALGMAAPQYPLPGPARGELLDAIA
jgi:RecA/RadA recombinase